MRVEVNGAEDFYALSKALKQTGRTEQRKELTKALKVAAKPLIPKVQAALVAATPGGVDPRAAKTSHVVQVKTGRDPGIVVGKTFAKRGRGLGHTNARMLNQQGQLRHPVFGDRQVWATTDVPGARGWFDDTMRRHAPEVRPEIEAAMLRIIDTIVREAKRG